MIRAVALHGPKMAQDLVSGQGFLEMGHRIIPPESKDWHPWQFDKGYRIK
jgi:hypothetical protein